MGHLSIFETLGQGVSGRSIATTGPPIIDGPGVGWYEIDEQSPVSCFEFGPESLDDFVCDLTEVYNPVTDAPGCFKTARLHLELESEREAAIDYLKFDAWMRAGAETDCLELDCDKLELCVIDKLTKENGGDACLTDPSDSTYFKPGYSFLAPRDPDVYGSLLTSCEGPGTPLFGGASGAVQNVETDAALRIVGEGIPRADARLIYLCR